MKPTTDEIAKNVTAKAVVAQKRLYFTPTHGPIEAESLEDAVAKVQKLEQTNKKEREVK